VCDEAIATKSLVAADGVQGVQGGDCLQCLSEVEWPMVGSGSGKTAPDTAVVQTRCFGELSGNPSKVRVSRVRSAG
jgi:hypothetical protein